MHDVPNRVWMIINESQNDICFSASTEPELGNDLYTGSITLR